MLVGTFDVETTAIGSCHQPSNRDVDDNAYSGDCLLYTSDAADE